MQKSYRFMLTILILGSYVLSACAGAVPQGSDPGGDAGGNSNEVTNMNDNSSDDGANSIPRVMITMTMEMETVMMMTIPMIHPMTE